VIVDTLVNATQTQVNAPGPVDVLDPSPAAPPSFTYRNGNPLVLTFTATDAGLAGLDAADATSDLVLSASNGTTTLNSYTVAAVEHPTTHVVTYTVTLAVPANATIGTYNVTATVRDRSGNVSDLTSLGAFKIANEVLATVELEGFTGTTRQVTFVAPGGTLQPWTQPHPNLPRRTGPGRGHGVPEAPPPGRVGGAPPRPPRTPRAPPRVPPGPPPPQRAARGGQ